METGKLKKFAQKARPELIEQVSARLGQVLADDSLARREQPEAVRKLAKEIEEHGEQEVIERAAYTWFNRFCALRFMDANHYNRIGVVSLADRQTQPEILAEAKSGHVDEKIVPKAVRERVLALLSGQESSRDPQGQAYRLLLVAACNYWHEAMPFMFERIADWTELLMPVDLLSESAILGPMREAMTVKASQDVEIIGWLYQFYISEKKDEVFAGLKKGKKISAENIPAATQLFTPHWIVRYLVENSLGRLWLLNRPGSKLAERMDYYIAPEEPETDFLRIDKPEEIKVCDPACGSGHMLTYAFDLLYAIYEEEGYNAAEISALILTHNLTGVEIDDRAGALAAFALAMKAAAKLGLRRFLRMEAKPDICVLQNVAFTEGEMQDVAAIVGKDLFTDELRETLGQFEHAKNFGSLIVPKLRDPAETLRVVKAQDFGGDLLLKEVQARVVALLRMAEALSTKYHVVATNPPYLGGKGMNSQIGTFAKDNYPDSKSDLFAMFMERALTLSVKNGAMAMINMQSWMFLSSFEKLRGKLLSYGTLLSMAHLGARSFDTIGGEVVSTTAFVFENAYRANHKGDYLRLLEGDSEAKKAARFKMAIHDPCCGWFYRAKADDFERIPGKPIVYWISVKELEAFSGPSIQALMDVKKGMAIGDNARFLRYWPEVSAAQIGKKARGPADTEKSRWFACLHGGAYRKWGGNREYVVNWKNNGAAPKNAITEKTGDHWSRYIISTGYFFRLGFNWSAISSMKFSARFHNIGFAFTSATMCAFAKKSRDDSIISLGLVNSPVGRSFSHLLSPTLNFGIAEIKKTPLIIPKRKKTLIASINKLISNSDHDWNAYETSWDFATLPLLSPAHRGETLEDSYTNLRAHWQGMTDEMQRLEEENNEIFIEAYGLQDELTPAVPLNEITLTCNPAYRYGVKGSEEERESRLRADTMAEFLSYAVGCMFGRYSLDKPGLILANQGETLEDYLRQVPAPSFEPDDDNVIPILDAAWFADGIVERFREFLKITFGTEHYEENLEFIENALGKDIRKYFLNDFYKDHVRRYKKRPIYWLFSSPKGSFNALIYMHRYRPDTVSVILNDYLREYREKLGARLGNLEAVEASTDASKRDKTAAVKEINQIRTTIDELLDWERKVILPLAEQKIEIDLDDGVKANYPKFGAALKKIPSLS